MGVSKHFRTGFSDWLVFTEAATHEGCSNMEKNTAAVTGCISKCPEDIIVSNRVTSRANQKPWRSAEVWKELKAQDADFRSGEKVILRTTQDNLARAIKKAYAQKIQGHFQNTRDTWIMWRGIQVITDYKPAPSVCDSDVSLPDSLNAFCTWFNALNSEPTRKSTLFQKSW